jgi:hypothetical protein
MRKSIYEVFFFIFALGLLTACFFFYTDSVKYKMLAEKNERIAKAYAWINDPQQAKKQIMKNDKLYKEMEREIGIPCEVLEAIGSFENGPEYFEFGCQKIPAEVVLTKPVCEWQARGASRVAIKCAFKVLFNSSAMREAYLTELAGTYCAINKDQWRRKVEELYYEFYAHNHKKN